MRHTLLLGHLSEKERFNYCSKFKSNVFVQIPLKSVKWKYELAILDLLKVTNYEREETLEMFLR